MLQAHNVVSISPTRPKGWRVRLFHQPADWNSLGRTLAEQKFRVAIATFIAVITCH